MEHRQLYENYLYFYIPYFLYFVIAKYILIGTGVNRNQHVSLSRPCNDAYHSHDHVHGRQTHSSCANKKFQFTIICISWNFVLPLVATTYCTT